MKVAVLSASPKQKLSLTLQTVRALKKMCPEDQFDICFIKDVNDRTEFEEKAKESDLILILSSLYHFQVHGQLISYLNGLKVKEGTPISYISTSGGNMDVPAHNLVRSFAKKNKLKWIRSLSLLDEDILKELRREELYRWFLYVKEMAADEKPESGCLSGMNVRVIDAGDTDADSLELAKSVASKYEALGANVKVFNLREKTIKGCIACFGCYTNNQCIIKDDFEALTQELYDNADMIVVVSNTCFNQFSEHYKYFLDRHVKFGRYGHDQEYYKAYICTGEINDYDMAELEQHTLVVDSLEQNYHVGIFREAELENMITESALACKNQLFPGRNTYTYGLSMQFANLAYRLQRMTPNDYNYFKARGYYELPEIIPNVKPISGLEDGRMSCKMRLIAFEEMLAQLDGPPKLTKRGERTKIDQPAVSEDKPKKGFSLFRKK